MKIAKIGFIGKAQISKSEQAKLRLMGRCIARAGRSLTVVLAQGAAEAVVSGVQDEEGRVTALQTGVISASDHTFVYADERLFARLKTVNPQITDAKNVTLIFSELELDLWLKSIHKVFEQAGLQPPV
jgi:hypothetical protein